MKLLKEKRSSSENRFFIFGYPDERDIFIEAWSEKSGGPKKPSANGN